MSNIDKTIRFGITTIRIQEYPLREARLTMTSIVTDNTISLLLGDKELDYMITTLCQIKQGNQRGMYPYGG